MPLKCIGCSCWPERQEECLMEIRFRVGVSEQTGSGQQALPGNTTFCSATLWSRVVFTCYVRRGTSNCRHLLKCPLVNCPAFLPIHTVVRPSVRMSVCLTQERKTRRKLKFGRKKSSRSKWRCNSAILRINRSKVGGQYAPSLWRADRPHRWPSIQ